MRKSENRKEKTIVLLIDFLGHPILGDEYVNNTRYSEIQKFISKRNISREDIVFVSNTISDRKLEELFKMARTVGFKTITLTEKKEPREGVDTSIRELFNIIHEKLGWDIELSNTQIIIGGCNFGGCVVNSKKISAVHWAQLGFKTTIHLPLCAEYEQPGVNSTEKAYNGFKQAYDFIKEHNAFNIKLTDKFEQLEFTFYEKK